MHSGQGSKDSFDSTDLKSMALIGVIAKNRSLFLTKSVKSNKLRDVWLIQQILHSKLKFLTMTSLPGMPLKFT